MKQRAKWRLDIENYEKNSSDYFERAKEKQILADSLALILTKGYND